MNAINNDMSIKENIIIMLKESMKFVLIGMIVFLVVGMSIAYILLYIVGMDVDVAGILAGIVTAILIITIDHKKIHAHDKILECHRRICRKILKI